MKTEGKNKVLTFLNYLGLSVLSLIFILPFYMLVVSSFVSEAELARRGNLILYPEQFNFDAYKLLLSGNSLIYSGYKNTIFVVLTGTVLSMLVTSTYAYAVSKKELPGRNFFNMFALITMIFSAGLIPSFLLNKSIGLLDNRWVIILPNLMSAWNMFILKNFFQEIPKSLEESAVIDGAGAVTVLFKIIIPLSLPAIATIGLFYGVGYWNAWFNAAIYLNNPAKLPIQNIMRNIVMNNDTKNLNNEMQNLVVNKPTAEALKSAVIVVSTIPIICVYPFIQKYFVKGVMVGSVKG